MKVSDYIVKFLLNSKIDKIFGVNGGLIEPLLLSAHNKNLEIINCASENQAALISQSYGYENKSFGVCFCVSGAGQSGLINGISTAFLENKKMIVISGDNNYNKIKKRSMQNTSENTGINFSKMIKECSAYSVKITPEDNIVEILNKAIRIMNETSKPVHIEIPKNIFENKIIDNLNKKTTIKSKKIKKDYLIKFYNIIKEKNTSFFRYQLSFQNSFLSLYYNKGSPIFLQK